MEELHSSPPSPRISPEGLPEGLILSGSGLPESEISQFNHLERNTAILLQTAAAAAGHPATAVLPQSQLAAASTGIPVSAVLQTHPMEGDTDSSVPSEMYKIQHESDPYSSADSETDSFNQSSGWTMCEDIREKKKRLRHERKSSNDAATDSSTDVDTMKAPAKPLLKVDVLKTSRTYLWNTGGKKAQVPKDISPPKTMLIEGVNIYLQILSSEEAKSWGIFGWDAVLADSKRFNAEIAERKIAQFWAGWRHNRVMSRRRKTQTPSTPSIQTLGPSAEAVKSNIISQCKDTPSVDAAKRKDTGTPGSAEPPSKKSLTTGQSYSRVAGVAPPPQSTTQTLWVHSHDADKGPIEKDIFFEIVSQCNILKNQGAIRGESEFCWKSNLKRQPSYDAENSRGKIVCGDQQTVDFWVKYIPIAAITVCSLKCKAWTWKEYEIPKVRYSCLIPFDTCSGLDTRDLVHGALAVNKLSMNDVITCRTSYAKQTQQRICNIEVTDELARAIDDADRVLVGPVCPLNFKLQSGDPEDPGSDQVMEPVCPDIPAIQLDEDGQLLNRNSAGGNVSEGVASSRILDSSNDPLNPPPSDTGSTSTVTSATSLNTKVKNLVVTSTGDPPPFKPPTPPPPPPLP